MFLFQPPFSVVSYLHHIHSDLCEHCHKPFPELIHRCTPPLPSKWFNRKAFFPTILAIEANNFRSILGFPRMGVNRDLKKATEAYWAGKLSQEDLIAEGKRLRAEHWKIQKDAGVDIIPSNDFSFYDHVLDHIQLFGVSVPASSSGLTIY